MGFLLGLTHQRSAFYFPEAEQAEEREGPLPNKCLLIGKGTSQKAKPGTELSGCYRIQYPVASAKHTALFISHANNIRNVSLGTIMGAETLDETEHTF